MKTKRLILLSALTLHVSAQDVPKPEEILSNAPLLNEVTEVEMKVTEAPKTKEELRKELKEEIKREMKEEQKMRREIAQEIKEEEEKKEVVENKEDPKKKSPLKKYGLGAYFGHSFVGSAYTISGSETTFTGNSIRVGLTKNVGQHKFRVGFESLNGSLDSMQVEGTKYSASALGIALSIKAKGLGVGYVYEATPNFAIGPYFKTLSGTTSGCSDSIGCVSADMDMTEIGLRIEGKVSYWNPYLEIGSSNVTEEGLTYKGASVYIGLLNLEF